MSTSKFHIIGHSLGAHVAGHAGKTFSALRAKGDWNEKIARISGLDPAASW